MTDLQIRNGLIYAVLWMANVLAICAGYALAAGTLPGFRDGEFLAPATAFVGAGLALLVPTLTGWLAANRPRLGSEQIAADVDKARAAGVSRRRLTVRTTKSEPLPPSQVAQVVAAVKAEMMATPARTVPPEPDFSINEARR